MPSSELDTIIQLLRSTPFNPDASFEEIRTQMNAMAEAQTLAEGTQTESFFIESVGAEWIVPAECRKDLTLLYLHGGGYCVGSIDTHRGLVSQISKKAKCRGLLIDYRMAPEHPFPAAVKDSQTAYEWLLSQKCNPDKIIIGGDSAGGGLSVATLLSLKETNLPLPAAAVLLSPWIDLAMTGKSITTKPDIDPMVDRDGLTMMAQAYLAGKDPRNPLASPLHGDFSGLPPMLIQVGTSEVLFDDAKRLDELAKAAGVDVTFEPWEDMIHVWQTFYDLLPEARTAIAHIGDFILNHT